MLINDILYSIDYSQFEPIRTGCQQFFDESESAPMVKLLPTGYEDFRKVKIRKKKPDVGFAESFNIAFEDEMRQFRERSLFANGEIFLENTTFNNDVEPFYVFPIDGFDYVYSKEVKNSSDNYSTVFKEIFEQMGEHVADKMFSELIKFSYTSQNLHEGLVSGAEIIIYGIPYYYTIRKSSIENYNELLTSM